jgi:hypothetical protein
MKMYAFSICFVQIAQNKNRSVLINCLFFCKTKDLIIAEEEKARAARSRASPSKL